MLNFVLKPVLSTYSIPLSKNKANWAIKEVKKTFIDPQSQQMHIFYPEIWWILPRRQDKHFEIQKKRKMGAATAEYMLILYLKPVLESSDIPLSHNKAKGNRQKCNNHQQGLKVRPLPQFGAWKT